MCVELYDKLYERIQAEKRAAEESVHIPQEKPMEDDGAYDEDDVEPEPIRKVA